MAVKRAFAVAGLNNIETALVKCTFDDDEIPKKKHIKTIRDYVEFELGGQGYNTSSTEVTLVELLRKRINKLHNQSVSWRVVIKSLITIHILFRECDRSFTEDFIGNNGQMRVLSTCENFFDNKTSSHSIVQSAFIRKYARYLSQKLIVFKHLDFNVERKLVQNNKDFFKQFDVDKLGKILPKIMEQLSILIEVECALDGNTYTVHPLDNNAMLLLIKDSLRIYSSIQLILWELLCSFQKLNLEQAVWINKTYAHYFLINDKYKEWFNKVIKYGIVNYQFAPNFDTLPKSLQNKLKTYITEQKKKKTNKKKRKQSEDSTESESESESAESDENDHEVGNLEDVLDQNELADFSNSIKNYKKKEKMKEEAKEDDLLGFSNFVNSSTQGVAKNNDDMDFISSLNLKTPRPVSKDAFSWSNDWNDNNQSAKNVDKESLDDFWSNVPVNNNQNNNVGMSNAMNSLNNVNINQNNVSNRSMSGGKARILKKNDPTNKDPFLDLLNFN